MFRKRSLMLAMGVGLLGCSVSTEPSGSGSTAGSQGSSTGTSGSGGSGGTVGSGTTAGSSTTAASSTTTASSTSATGGASGGGSVTSAGGASGGGSSGASGGIGGAGGSSGGGAPVDGGRLDAASDASTGSDAPSGDSGLARFSFFVTSLQALRTLSGNDKGFGGDLRFGKADGLSGADEICTRIAETSMPGSGRKTWHAFLSAVSGPGGTAVNAIDRIGNGPWYDRLGRIVAMTKADLAQSRPRGAAAQIINDLPNEQGIPNGYPVPGGPRVDNHHTLTGSKADGTVNSTNRADTCNDWTSSMGSAGKPRVGVSWPRSPGDHWISWGTEGGCAPGYNLIEGAGATEGNMAVGSNGGYGGFYCFALEP